MKHYSLQVYFQTMPEMKVYVKSYGGWMMSLTDKINADRLTDQLDAVGAQYKQDHHYAVGYNRSEKALVFCQCQQ